MPYAPKPPSAREQLGDDHEPLAVAALDGMPSRQAPGALEWLTVVRVNGTHCSVRHRLPRAEAERLGPDAARVRAAWAALESLSADFLRREGPGALRPDGSGGYLWVPVEGDTP